MSISKFVLPSGGNRNQKFRREWNWRTWSWKKCARPDKECRGDWNWKTWSWNERFPLLSLPDEMISHIFSFLPTKDRMRARVNKRLDKIELDSKYFVKTLRICQIPIDPYYQRHWKKNDQLIFFDKEKSYSSDCIKRIFHNISVRYLFVQLSGVNKFHHEICKLIPSLKHLRGLVLQITNEETIFTIMDDAFFLDLARNIDKLDLGYHMIDDISPEALHEAYKMLLDPSGIILLRIKIELNHCIRFLKLIGITNADGKFFSSRDGLEVYRLPYTDDTQEYHIFDGNMQIQFEWEMIEFWMFLEGLEDEDEKDDWYETTQFPVLFRRHSTKESLEKAKNTEGFEKLDDFFSTN